MTDNKINIKSFEKQIGKNLNKIYKNITGRGPINTEVRVVNQSIFIVYRTELLPYEGMLFGFIRSKNQEHEFFDFVRPTFTAVINTYMKEINPFLSVDGMEFRLDDDTTYMLVTLNKNLEKMLLSGEAKMSHTDAD